VDGNCADETANLRKVAVTKALDSRLGGGVSHQKELVAFFASA
jgi:hypothetical protein